MPQALVELYASPHVKVEAEGQIRYYGHGLWLTAAADGQHAVYIVGGDAGVSFLSRVRRTVDLQVTVISNTSNGTWKVLREIEQALGY